MCVWNVFCGAIMSELNKGQTKGRTVQWLSELNVVITIFMSLSGVESSFRKAALVSSVFSL